MFYREWAVIVEIERHPATALRLHAAEQALMSDDPQVRDAAIHDAGEIVRAAHRSVADVPDPVTVSDLAAPWVPDLPAAMRTAAWLATEAGLGFVVAPVPTKAGQVVGALDIRPAARPSNRPWPAWTSPGRAVRTLSLVVICWPGTSGRCVRPSRDSTACSTGSARLAGLMSSRMASPTPGICCARGPDCA
jgi:hypothetical protein